MTLSSSENMTHRSRTGSIATRHCNHGGVAMSLETRPPRELLEQIGLNGKEVVKIIKTRGWDILEPHGLQQQNLYYIPEVKQNGAPLIQNETFFVGEGELYAFILEQGGIRYLLPDEELSDIEPTTWSDSIVEQSTKRSDEYEDDDKKWIDNDDEHFVECSSDGRKWKRRKKLSTARAQLTEVVDTVTETSLDHVRRYDVENVNTVDHDENAEMNLIQESEEGTIDDEIRYAAIGQEKEFTMYQKSLKARGWRAQLLQDIDVHLLRSAAAVDRIQRGQQAVIDRKKKRTRITQSGSPHVVDPADIRQEIETLMKSIRASQDDLSSIIETIISDAEQHTRIDRIDAIGRIGISGFVSTGIGNLTLIRDIERYLLLVVAAVRRYQRWRESLCISGPTSGSYVSSNRAVKREELRALQLGIEDSKKELYELAAILVTDFAKSCQDVAQDTIPEDSTLNTSQMTSSTTLQRSSSTLSRTVRDVSST